jgi:rod shape-determining protein MreC
MAAAKSNQQFHSAFSPALGLRFLLLAGLSLLIIVDAPVSIWRWTVDTTASRNELQLENSRLNAERLLTQARLQRYSSLEAENARLRTMLEARATVREQVRVAEILSVSSDPFRHLLVVDKGSVDNVYDGQVVIDANGVVGQVIKAGVLSSQCMLISDPGHALPVEVNRNGLRTIARGTGEFDKLDLPFLPNNADIEPGDLLVTSGRGGAFPAGYPVAIVDSVIRIPQEPFASVTATPAASLNQVREVMLIWSAPQESKESVEVTPAEASDSVDEEADEQSNE